MAPRWLTRALLASCCALSCAEVGDDPREATVTSVLARADLAWIRARPALEAGRLARMAASPYDFYRGSVALFLHDWRDGASGLSRSRFALDWPAPFTVGDAHPENFGLLLGADGALSIEPNDLDAADRAPYLWDLRRLCVGLSLAARLSNDGDPAAREAAVAAARSVARAAAEGYATAVRALASGAPREVISDGGGVALLDDLFRRGARDRDRRAELDGLTTLDGGARRLRRGVLDPEEPTAALSDLPAFAREAIPATLERYRRSLPSPPSPASLTVLDAAREYGSGVASWPRVRALVLVRGESDDPGDDVILELKELGDPTLPPSLAPGVWFDDVAARVRAASRALWSRPAADPWWGTSEWLGVPVQLRRETEAAKTVRVSRMTGTAGTPDALRALAARLGAALAGVHAAPLPDGGSVIRDIDVVIQRSPAAFADEQADVAERYAPVVLADAARLRRALSTLGPRLGVPPDPRDAPRPDLAALLGPPETP
ncbi:MAG: DUF2252 family protein [Polyangiales bacterium]